MGPEPVEGLPSVELNPKSEILNPNSDIPLLTPEEKRRILARIARVNATDCFDESGAFDLARAKRVLPPGAVRSIAVHETTLLNAEGQPVTERRIHLRLVDPVSALRLDDQLERRRERSTSSSSSHSDSDSDSSPPHPASPEYAHNLLRKNTIALDEAQDTLARLKKALAEKEARRRQLSKELDEKNQQLSKTLSPSNGSETLSLSNGSQTLSKVEGETTQRLKDITPSSESQSTNSQALQSQDQSWEAGFSTPLSGKTKSQNAGNPTLQSHAQPAQRDTGCQPVEPKYHTPPPAPSHVADQTLDKHRALEIQRRNREIEYARNTNGTLGFANWLRIKQKEWAAIDARAASTNHQTTHHQKTATGQTTNPPARPPPR